MKIKLLRVLTDRVSEYCGKSERHVHSASKLDLGRYRRSLLNKRTPAESEPLASAAAVSGRNNPNAPYVGLIR